jgi:hypothetical protein
VQHFDDQEEMMTMHKLRRATAAMVVLPAAAIALSHPTFPTSAAGPSSTFTHAADAAAWKYYGTYGDSTSCENAGASSSQGRKWKCTPNGGAYDLYILF